MRITFPRVVSVRRVDPNRFSVGDEAVCEFGPGLFEFLQLRDPAGRFLGEGLAPEWTIPVGAAVNAAYAVMFPAGREDLNQFTGVGHKSRRIRPCELGETLLARAWLESAGRKLRIGYKVVSRERRDMLVEGLFSFVAIGPSGLQSFDPHLFPTRPDSAAPEVERPSAPPPPPRPRRPGIADAILPRELARALRITYWHWLDRSRERTPIQFSAALLRALRDPNAHGLPDRARTRAGRLVDLVIPGAIASRLRELRARRGIKRSSGPVTYLRILPSPSSLALGSVAVLTLEVQNPTALPLEADVEVTEPFGFGLAFAWDSGASLHLGPGEKTQVNGKVTALRPDEVNLGKPWPLLFTLRSRIDLASETTHIAVPDPNPGVLFYVLTEDCETFDGGGLTGDYGTMRVLGNHNDYMDPEDYRIQMIEKPNALNAIAERHGAAWTHFWTVPQRFAAAWAATQSTTGAWDRLVRDLDDSVRSGSRRHEYAPHIHFDFEPDSKLSPQPRLRYDPRTDGFLPNDYYNPTINRDHKYHGWDGARKGIAYVKLEGNLSTLDSKKGSLRKAVRHLADLSFGGVPTLTTRTGAADFGDNRLDLEISRDALLANGLLANSDAGVYYTPKPLPRGRQIYYCRNDDLEVEVSDMKEASLVQLRAPARQLEQGTTVELNAWFDQRVEESQGSGVRAIVAMTHAMFMKGAPDPFRNTTGGDFQKLDEHLAHVRQAHPAVRFATASEAVLEFLDYYTPMPRAVAMKPRARSLDGRTLLYPIRILGRGIPISVECPARLTVFAPPLFDPDQVASLSVLERGIVVSKVYAPFGYDQLPAVEFQAAATEGYDLQVEVVNPVQSSLSDSDSADMLPEPPLVRYEEWIETQGPDLFRLERPTLRKGPVSGSVPRLGDSWEWWFPGDLFNLLVHPIGGGVHPIARRFHPYAMISEGAILYCARALFDSSWVPERSAMRWMRALRGKADFRVLSKLESTSEESREISASFFEADTLVAEGHVSLRFSGHRS